METRDNFELGVKPSNSFVQKLHFLGVTGIFMTAVTLTGFIAYGQGMANANHNQQQLACNKLNSGGMKAEDIASLGLVPGVKDILTELQKVQIQLAKEKLKYTDVHPVIVKLKSEEAALKSLLRERFKGICQVFNA
ncbi:MAG: hypothetical protein HC908_13565 [Calothrix sp. SM1_7_51]|nr:hypothetical protein [Calothrix sp. SM1_7_51]